MSDCLLTACVRLQTVREVYSNITYEIIFRGNPSNATKIYHMQKRILGLIKGYVSRKHFKNLKIIPLSGNPVVGSSIIYLVTLKKEKSPKS